MPTSEPTTGVPTNVESRVAELACTDVSLPEDVSEKAARFVAPSHSVWTRLNELGTELWLDTGDMDEASRLWSSEFTALTTNNTLLSKEVGKGIYDDLIQKAVGDLRGLASDLSDEVLVGEVGLLLNARHGLRLVEKFGCRVSVELHTDLANELEASLRAANRLYAMCPSHFIVKVPLSPTGILVARRLVNDGVPINFTLEFSARQNYVVARLANPNYVNVFLGRLNSFVADHGLGDGRMIGEKATLASQRVLLGLRGQGGQTRQIAASMREAKQITDLAGVDVFTMPTAVAEGMPSLELSASDIETQVEVDPSIRLSSEVDPAVLESLWEVPQQLKAAVEALSREDLDKFNGEDLANFLRQRGHGDLFPNWSQSDLVNIDADGKIPSYPRWREQFELGEVGLDAALNMAGMASFALDQRALDDRIRSFL